MVHATAAIHATAVTTVLVSNSLGRSTYAWCEFDALFDHVITSAEVGVRKPSRRIFRLAAQRAGVPPERCVMVDDLEQNLVGARRVGMRTILHTDPATTRAELEQVFGIALEAAA
jgi:putative hydrolase of the HAD superfamily